MAGIYGVVSRENLDIDTPIYEYFYTSHFAHSVNEEIYFKHCVFGRSVINKFLNDRTLFQDDELIIGFEGIFFNKEDEQSFNTIKRWYQQIGPDFVKKIKGQFSGFIYDKILDKLIVFSDHLSTKPLYLYKSKAIFIFASEFKVITQLLKKLSIKKELDYDGVYSMLTFGYMLDNITLEKNTKKMKHSTVLEVDKDFKATEKQYFSYKKEQNLTLKKKDIIEKIDTLLLKSVEQCWGKDSEYGYKHYSFLSGGLDSRVNVFLAKELGYRDILTLTFSQSGSSDQKIAQKIAEDESFQHVFYPLDNGTFLEQNLRHFVKANDGLVIFNGSAAGYDILSSFDENRFGALHTGQIGDLLFGSYVKKNFDVRQGLASDRFALLKEITFFEEYTNRYRGNPELFGYEQRVMNGTFNGDRTLSHFTDVVSPFYDKELISFCLSIPDVFKQGEAIYLDWFNTKHKKIAKYQWESAGVKPKNIVFVKLAKFIKRYKNAVLRRTGLQINDMNPFDLWLKNNKKIVDNLDKSFDDTIGLVTDSGLKEILKDMYYKDDTYSHYGRNNKFLVITLLLSMELHFAE